MSDFDKEAERKKLREKYERDKQKREATERMSELLLQGATMTNAHCSECGDPIFRYDGQEFCATCQRPVDRDRDDSEEGDDGAAGNVEVTTPRDDAFVTFGGQGDDAQANGVEAEDDEKESPPPETDLDDRQAPPAPSSENQHRGRPPADPDDTRPERVPGLDPEQNDDLQGAKQALIRTLARFSANAESATDPQQAREHLQAAREAAETLAALRR